MAEPSSIEGTLHTKNRVIFANMLGEAMTNGLYIGKLAPIHKGHQKIIDAALQEVDHLTIFIYNSKEFDDAHPHLDKILRAFWVKRMYPECDVRIGYNPPPDDYTPEGDIAHAEYVARHMDRDIHYLFGGEGWIQTMAPAMGARPRQIPRDNKGISATAIRQDPIKYAWYMTPEVRDYMLIHYGREQGLTI